MVNLGFNRVGLYNWAGGGQNSISINGLASFYAYHTKGNSTWDSNLDIAFGVIRTGFGPDVPWFKMMIELSSILNLVIRPIKIGIIRVLSISEPNLPMVTIQ